MSDFSANATLRAIREATRWLFLLTLIYAPWAYGCTTAVTVVILNYLLGAVMFLWVADLLLRRTKPTISPGLIILVGVLLVIGWGMSWNAKGVYDTAFEIFAPAPQLVAWLPGSLDAPNSIAWMIRATLLLLSVCFVADLVQRPAWLLRLWYAIGIGGGSIALFGLIEKASGARMIFWEDWPAKDSPTFFATYFYHANAGAFLNLVFPLTVGMAARMFQTTRSVLVKTVWLTAGIAVTVAIIANTSRAAQAIGVVSMLIVAVLLLPQVRSVVGRAEKGTIAAGILVGALAIYAVAQASRLDQPIKRWSTLSSQIGIDARWDAQHAAIVAIPEASWFGFGPGTFRSIFPHYVEASHGKLEGTWRFLHEDYLQTILEWGWVGSLFWALLFFGGLLVAFRALRRGGNNWLPRQRSITPLVLIALVSIALHSLVDFPLQIASIQLYAAVYLGICWAAATWSRG